MPKNKMESGALMLIIGIFLGFCFAGLGFSIFKPQDILGMFTNYFISFSLAFGIANLITRILIKIKK